MNITVRTSIMVLLTALAISACSSTPAPTPEKGPYDNADSQRSRAHQTQDELSSETRKK